jgi:hypothetical protein
VSEFKEKEAKKLEAEAQDKLRASETAQSVKADGMAEDDAAEASIMASLAKEEEEEAGGKSQEEQQEASTEILTEAEKLVTSAYNQLKKAKAADPASEVFVKAV